MLRQKLRKEIVCRRMLFQIAKVQGLSKNLLLVAGDECKTATN